MEPTQTYGDAELGRRVRAARINAGLHQRELADLVGVTREAISRIECGTLRPSEVRLTKIAKATEVDRRELAGTGAPETAPEQAAGSAA